MQLMSPARLRADLAIWLRLIPQHVRRDWCERNTHGRDAAADAIARMLVDRLRHHEVWAPDPLTCGVPVQGALKLEPGAGELGLDVPALAAPSELLHRASPSP